MLVVVVVAGLLMAAVFQTVIVQQRSYRQQYSITNARHVSRTTLDLLAVELRELSAASGDLLMASENSLRFRSYRKVGIVCAVPVPAVDRLLVQEFGESVFVGGDAVLVYQEEDDDWIEAAIESAASATTTCPDGSEARELTLNADVSTVRTGAPVRGYQIAAYGLEFIDGKWALARQDDAGTPVSLVEPLASEEDGGLRFRYYDDANTNPITLTDVRRIEVIVRGMSRGTGSVGQLEYLDSLSLQINLRGN
jgi:hypothetical protein